MTALATSQLGIALDYGNTVVYVNPLAPGAFRLLAPGEHVVETAWFRQTAATTYVFIDGLTAIGTPVFGLATGLGVGQALVSGIRFKVGLGLLNSGANNLQMMVSFR